MLTNQIAITDIPPTLSANNIDVILKRIKQLHPNLNGDGCNKYLCDLLNIKNVAEITGDFLNFQETKPALSSAELHQLADRVLAYNNNDIDQAVFATRNILNSRPKSVDDLIDYTTKERVKEFIQDVLDGTLIHLINDTGEIKDVGTLAKHLEPIPEIVIDMICNKQMDKSKLVCQTDKPGITQEQQMLYCAADYYLNHKIGFKCNTIWLACFIHSKFFGCTQGWIHNDGTECRGTHFGFKNDEDTIKLVLQAKPYIELYLNGIQPERANTDTITNFYINTLIFAFDTLQKKHITTPKPEYDKQTNTILGLLDKYEKLLTNEQKLMIENIINAQSEQYGISKKHFELLEDVVNNRDQAVEPAKYIISNFDAWNFFVLDVEYVDSFEIMPMFIKSHFNKNAMRQFSHTILEIYNNSNLDEHNQNLIKGYFENFLFIMVNENSDSMYMFDEILNCSITASESIKEINNKHVIRAMAELGHLKSMIEMSKRTNGNETDYWEKRINFLTEAA